MNFRLIAPQICCRISSKDLFQDTAGWDPLYLQCKLKQRSLYGFVWWCIYLFLFLLLIYCLFFPWRIKYEIMKDQKMGWMSALQSWMTDTIYIVELVLKQKAPILREVDQGTGTDYVWERTACMVPRLGKKLSPSVLLKSLYSSS